MKYLIVTHAVFIDGIDIYGPPHTVSEHLEHARHEHVFIKHDLSGIQPTKVDQIAPKGKSRSEEFQLSGSANINRYFQELFLTVKLGRAHKPTITIATDPLNACAALVLKFLGDTSHVIYLSADFATKRFPSIPMNVLYHALDHLSMYFADQTWSVSQRIVNFRKRHLLPDSKNKHFPNTPLPHEIPSFKLSEKDRNQLVVVSALENTIDFDILLQAIQQVRQSHRKVTLHIIGNGSKKADIQKQAKKLDIANAIQFLGAMSHQDMFKVLVKAGVGIALYNDADQHHFRYYSDPMKVRDYTAAGCPVIISGNSGLGYEIDRENIGFLVEKNSTEIAKAIKDIINSKDSYHTHAKRAMLFSKKYDKSTLIDTYLRELT